MSHDIHIYSLYIHTLYITYRWISRNFYCQIGFRVKFGQCLTLKRYRAPVLDYNNHSKNERIHNPKYSICLYLCKIWVYIYICVVCICIYIYIVYVCTHSYTYIIHSHQPHWVNGLMLNCTGYFGLSRQGHFQPSCFSAPFQLALSQNGEHNQQPYALVYIKAMKWHEHSKCWAPWEILRTSETMWFNVKRSNERDSAGIFRMKSLSEFCCTIGWSQAASVMRLSDAAMLRAMFAKGCQCESDFGRWWP